MLVKVLILWRFLLPESAIDHVCNDLVLIDLAAGLGRVFITSFIPVVLVFLGFRRRNAIGGDFFIWELKTLHEIHHNLLSFVPVSYTHLTLPTKRIV